MRLLVALFSGVLLGLGFVISRMVNPAKILGFLDVAGDWDPRRWRSSWAGRSWSRCPLFA